MNARHLAREWLWFIASLPVLLAGGFVECGCLPRADEWFDEVVPLWIGTYGATIAVRLTIWAIRTVKQSGGEGASWRPPNIVVRTWAELRLLRLTEPHDTPGMRLVKIGTVVVNVAIVAVVGIVVVYSVWAAL